MHISLKVLLFFNEGSRICISSFFISFFIGAINRNNDFIYTWQRCYFCFIHSNLWYEFSRIDLKQTGKFYSAFVMFRNIWLKFWNSMNERNENKIWWCIYFCLHIWFVFLNKNAHQNMSSISDFTSKFLLHFYQLVQFGTCFNRWNFYMNTIWQFGCGYFVE